MQNKTVLQNICHLFVMLNKIFKPIYLSWIFLISCIFQNVKALLEFIKMFRKFCGRTLYHIRNLKILFAPFFPLNYNANIRIENIIIKSLNLLVILPIFIAICQIFSKNNSKILKIGIKLFLTFIQ